MGLLNIVSSLIRQITFEKPPKVSLIHKALKKPKILSDLLYLYLQSSEFQQRAPRTQLDYKRYVKIINHTFGCKSIAKIEDYKIRAEFLVWRDEIALNSKRKADYAITVLGVVLEWARNRALISQNHAARSGKLYNGNRASIVWSKTEIDLFLSYASEEMKLAMILARDTGQRRGDLLRLTWAAYDGEYISFKQSKTGTVVEIPATKTLKTLLDETKLIRKWCGICNDNILLRPDGKAWGESHFQKTWRCTSLKAAIQDKKFQDLRGTTITALADAGCTTLEIAAITGHTFKSVDNILKHYVSVDNILKHYVVRTRKKASSAMRKLEANI